MSTSATERYARIALAYVIAALACALFGAVYEGFSHGVYAAGMVYAFLFPLAGGALPFGLLAAKGSGRIPDARWLRLYHFGIAAWTVGSIVKGVLDIYGTTNGLVRVYWILGAVLTAAGAALSVAEGRRSRG